MRSDEKRIAIVGAGIAGLTAAAALCRAGVRCEVFEQTRQLGEVGAGIQIAPNAARVLERLGLGRHLDMVGVRPAAIEMRRWDDDRVLRRQELGERCAEMFGVPYYSVHRADLHRGLLQLLPSGTVHLGLRCVGIEERPDEVELRFEDGSRLPFDVVIGADGIHSVVRDLLASDQPRFSGQSIYRGLVPADRVPFLLTEPKVTLWLGPHRHCVCYPVSGGRQVSFGATTPVADVSTESWSAQGSVDELRAAYAGWTDRVTRLLAAADHVSQWALHDRDTVERWSTRRVTLIGDAAHPMLPFLAQGANQAIEDAMVLAVFLRDASGPDDVADALARYADVRRARTDEVHGISRRNTTMLHLPDGDEQRKRDEILAASADLRSQEWLFGYDAEVAAQAA